MSDTKINPEVNNNDNPVVEPGNIDETKPATGEVDNPEVNQGDEPLGDAGKRALDAERAARKESDKKLSDALKRIDEFEDSQRSEEEKRTRAFDKIKSENENLKSENEKLERKLLIRDVIDEVGLPKKLASRLEGNDYDSLVEDAKNLKELFAPSEDDKKPRKPTPVKQVGENGGGSKGSTAELFSQFANDAFNR